MICGRVSIGRRRQWRFERESKEVSAQLGTLEELPRDYREAMARASIGPLWPSLRDALPHGAPKAVTQPNLWNYSTIRPLLLRAGELTPVEKAERRVLFLIDPGRGAAAMQVTSALYVGFQLLLTLRSCGCVFHVISGRGASIVNRRKYIWGPKDTFSARVFTDIEHQSGADAPAFLIRIHDARLQEKLGYYEERGR
jgi:gentisate 1,2-dioxygenase